MVLTGILDYRNAFQTFTARRNQQKDLAVELSRAAQKAQTACSALRAFESDRMKETEIFSNKMILAEPLLPLSSVSSWPFHHPVFDPAPGKRGILCPENPFGRSIPTPGHTIQGRSGGFGRGLERNGRFPCSKGRPGPKKSPRATLPGSGNRLGCRCLGRGPFPDE